MTTDPKDFWEQKILTWEDGRYSAGDLSQNAMEEVANKASSSLRFRLRKTAEMLRPELIEGKRVVEFGCGSGFLSELLIESGAISYQGFDISENAIRRANGRIQEKGLSDKISFSARQILDVKEIEADIVVSLGLLDWLNDAELDHLFKISGNADYIHSISEKRASLAQLAHRLYVFVAYGFRTGGYVPKYYTVEKIRDMLSPYNKKTLGVYRHNNLSFGALLTSLNFKG